MIRKYLDGDIDQVLQIWLSASIQAHGFVEPEYWEAKVSDMRRIYIPASETFVLDSNHRIAGFYCLSGNTLAAIFVSPDLQGNGVGKALLEDAMSRRENLRLTVYRENERSVQFYLKHGFIVAGEQVDDYTGHAELVMEYHARNGAATLTEF